MGRTLPEVRCWLCPYLKYWFPRGSSVTTTCFPPAVQPNHVQNRHKSGSPPEEGVIIAPAQMSMRRSRQPPAREGWGRASLQTQCSEASALLAL